MAKAKVWNIEELRKKYVTGIYDSEPVALDDGSHTTKISQYIMDTMKELNVPAGELQHAVYEISLDIAASEDPSWIDDYGNAECVRDIIRATTITVYTMLTSDFVRSYPGDATKNE